VANRAIIMSASFAAGKLLRANIVIRRTASDPHPGSDLVDKLGGGVRESIGSLDSFLGDRNQVVELTLQMRLFLAQLAQPIANLSERIEEVEGVESVTFGDPNSHHWIECISHCGSPCW
jgi:hypothetical protein